MFFHEFTFADYIKDYDSEGFVNAYKEENGVSPVYDESHETSKLYFMNLIWNKTIWYVYIKTKSHLYVNSSLENGTARSIFFKCVQNNYK